MIKQNPIFLLTLALTILWISPTFAESPFEAFTKPPFEVTLESVGDTLKSPVAKECPSGSKYYRVSGRFKSLPVSFSNTDSFKVTGLSDNETKLFVEDLHYEFTKLREDARWRSVWLWLVDYARDKLKDTLDDECVDKGGGDIASGGYGQRGDEIEASIQACCKDDMYDLHPVQLRHRGSAFVKHLKAQEPEKLGYELKGEIDISER